MTKTVYWLQCGGCGGNSMAALSMESPDLIELLAFLELEVLWHPSLSNGSPAHHKALSEAIIAGEQPLDMLCVEGAVIRGPGGTGMYDTFDRKPKKDLVAGMAAQAQFVLALGTCASFGGVTAAGEVEATGIQFHRNDKGGFLGAAFTAGSGLPVINLPGCPCHCDVLAGVLTALTTNSPLPLTSYNTPLEWYGLLIHQGCIRNEYYEYGVEEDDFGQRGCLFFHMGCRGPLTYGPCNKLLWNNRRSSKTRAGVPCSGCTQPDFPRPHPSFQTRNIADIPLELPDGVDRAHYMAYKGLAQAAAPARLKERKTRL